MTIKLECFSYQWLFYLVSYMQVRPKVYLHKAFQEVGSWPCLQKIKRLAKDKHTNLFSRKLMMNIKNF
jgi:hypothetical protein